MHYLKWFPGAANEALALKCLSQPTIVTLPLWDNPYFKIIIPEVKNKLWDYYEVISSREGLDKEDRQNLPESWHEFVLLLNIYRNTRLAFGLKEHNLDGPDPGDFFFYEQNSLLKLKSPRSGSIQTGVTFPALRGGCFWRK